MVASHIKPWAKSNNAERLDGNNGFLLSPHVDKLFDRGWISFQDNGDILCANHMAEEVMRSWGLSASVGVGGFNDRQKAYLAYHREYVYEGRWGAWCRSCGITDVRVCVSGSPSSIGRGGFPSAGHGLAPDGLQCHLGGPDRQLSTQGSATWMSTTLVLLLGTFVVLVLFRVQSCGGPCCLRSEIAEQTAQEVTSCKSRRHSVSSAWVSFDTSRLELTHLRQPI